MSSHRKPVPLPAASIFGLSPTLAPPPTPPAVSSPRTPVSELNSPMQALSIVSGISERSESTPRSLPPISACRPVSPPTPAPSPQPIQGKPAEGQPWTHSTAFPNVKGLSNPSNLALEGPEVMLEAFQALPSQDRIKFLTSLLPYLTLPELTTLSTKISPRLKRDFLRELPLEIALYTLSFIDDPKTLMRAGMVSRFWRALVLDEATWKGMCWRRGFSGQPQLYAKPNLQQRMELERKGRVQQYRVGVEERRKRKALAAVNSIPAEATESPFPLEISASPRGDAETTILSPLFPRAPPPTAQIDQFASSSDVTYSTASSSSSLPDVSDDEASREGPDGTNNTPVPRSFTFATPDRNSVPHRALARQGTKFVHATSPNPGKSGPAPTDANSPRRSRRKSMPFLSIPKSNSTPTTGTFDAESSPTSTSYADLDSPPSSATSPLPAFSYKSIFKRAYLTESNWLRGPGRLLETQTGADDGVVTSVAFDDEWIVIGMATNKIHIFGAQRGEFIRTLSGHELGVWTLALVSPGGERDPRDVHEGSPMREKGKSRASKFTDFENADEQHDYFTAAVAAVLASANHPPQPYDSHHWTSTRHRQTTGGLRDGRGTAGLGVAGASLSPLRHRTHRVTSLSGPPTSSIVEDASRDYFAGVGLSPRNVTNASLGVRPLPLHDFGSGPSAASGRSGGAVSPGTSTSRLPNPAGVLETDSSYRRPRRRSSFSSFISQRSVHAGAWPNELSAAGGMGLGAGGNTSGSAQHASACGVSRGWGQKRSIVVSGGCDREMRVWDVRTGLCIYILRGHTSTIRCLQVINGRPIAVTGSRDTTLRVWDIERGVAKHVLVGHEMSVRAIEVSGSRVVSGSYDTTSRLWDIETGQCLRVFRGHCHPIYAVAFDGSRIATGSLDSTVCIWTADTGELVALLQGHTALVGQVQINGPSNMLVTGGSDGRVIVFSLSTYECIHRLCAHDNSVTCLQFDDRFLVTGGNDGRVKLWDMKTGAFIRELAERCEVVWSVTFRDDRAVLLCKRNGRTVLDVLSFRPTPDELA